MDFSIPEEIQTRAKETREWIENVLDPLSEPLEKEDKFPKDLFEELDLKILWGLYETTCQSEVAKRVGMTQSRIRHRFMKNLEVLDKVKHAEIYTRYFDAFKLISNNNFNIKLISNRNSLHTSNTIIDSN